MNETIIEDEIIEDEIDILDTISYISQSQTVPPNRFTGKFSQIKINETGEIVNVYETTNKIRLKIEGVGSTGKFSGILADSVGYLEFYQGEELKTLVVDEKYQSYKLGDFLVKKAVEEYKCWWVNCGGTRAYKLYRKYGFVPTILDWTYPTSIKKNLIEEYNKILKSGEELKIRPVILMIQKDRLGKFGLDYEKDIKPITEYCDKKYKGYYDSKQKKLTVGDSVNFKDGRTGIVEDYDNKYFYIRDNNANIVKIFKDNTPKDYTSIQNMASRLKSIIKETSTFQEDKNFGAVEFKKLLEANGFEVEYVENKSGTWQKDDYNEYFKNYDIKLTDGQHIYFRVIADDNFDTKEIICYLNGKNW